MQINRSPRSTNARSRIIRLALASGAFLLLTTACGTTGEAEQTDTVTIAMDAPVNCELLSAAHAGLVATSATLNHATDDATFAQMIDDLDAIDADLATLRPYHPSVDLLADDLAAAQGGQFGMVAGGYDLHELDHTLAQLGC